MAHRPSFLTLLKQQVPPLMRGLPVREETATLVLGVFVGVLAGYGAVAFIWMLEAVGALALSGQGPTGESTLAQTVAAAPWWLIVAVPALGGLIVGILVTKFAPEARGHGVPEVMEAMALRGGKIRPRVAIVKTCASAVTIGTGGSVGREGPIVQVGAAIGSAFGQFLGVSSVRLRRLAACGAAGGIAAAFNTPIAGAIFALEIILGDFGIGSFAPIMLACVAATVISRFHLGEDHAFQVPHYELVSGFDIIAFALLGILAGLVALFFVKVLYGMEDGWEKLPAPSWLKPALGGALVGGCICVFPQLWGGGYGTMHEAIAGQLPGLLLLGLVAAKAIATSFTLGSGGSGGVFAPSLFLGCMAGGAFGVMLEHWVPDLTAPAGAYALVGMGAVVAGSTHAPITAILILFELTDSYELILPIMIACILSSITYRSITRDSVYAVRLRRRGVTLEGGRERRVLESLRVGSIMSRRITTLPASMPFDEVTQAVTRGRFQYFPVVDEENRLEGILSFNDVRGYLLGEERPPLARDIMTKEVVTLLPQDSLLAAMRAFDTVDVEQLPVVAHPEDPEVVGILSRGDIIRVYNREVLRQFLSD